MAVKKTSGYYLSQQEPLDTKSWLTSNEMNALPLSDRYPWMIITNKDTGKLHQLSPKTTITTDYVNDWYFKLLEFSGGTGSNIEWENGIEYEIGNIKFYNGRIFQAIEINIDEPPLDNNIVNSQYWNELPISINQHEINKDIRLGNYRANVAFNPIPIVYSSIPAIDIINQVVANNIITLFIPTSSSRIGHILIDYYEGQYMRNKQITDIIINFSFHPISNPTDVIPSGEERSITFVTAANVDEENGDTNSQFKLYLGPNDITFTSKDGMIGQFIHFKLDENYKLILYNSSKQSTVDSNKTTDLKPVLDILPDLSSFPTTAIGDRYIVYNSIYEMLNGLYYEKVLDSSNIEIGKGIVVTKSPASWYIWNGTTWNKDANYNPTDVDNIKNHLYGDDSVYNRFETALEQDLWTGVHTLIRTSRFISDSILNHISSGGLYWSYEQQDSPNPTLDVNKVTIYDIKKYNSMHHDLVSIEAIIPSTKKKYIAIYSREEMQFELPWTQTYPILADNIESFNLGDLTGKTNYILSVDANGKVVVTDASYTDNVPVADAFQGIGIGETFNKVPINDMINKIIHKYNIPVANVFTIGLPTFAELGTNYDVSPLVTWNIQNSQNVLISTPLDKHIKLLDVTNGNTSLVTSDLVTYSANVAIINTNVIVSRLFRLQFTDIKNNVINKDITIYGVNPIYFGTGLLTSLTASDVIALQKYLNTTWKTNYNYVAGGYKYFIIPVSTGVPTMFKDLATGFQVAMESPVAITISGISYNVYRTSNILNSSITITVS